MKKLGDVVFFKKECQSKEVRTYIIIEKNLIYDKYFIQDEITKIDYGWVDSDEICVLCECPLIK